MADSYSPLVKGFEEPMAAVEQAINDATAQLPKKPPRLAARHLQPHMLQQA